MKSLFIKLCLFNLILIFGVNAYAQTNDADSLNTDSSETVQRKAEDSNRVNMLRILKSKSYRDSLYKKSMQYANQALEMTKKIKLNKKRKRDNQDVVNAGLQGDDVYQDADSIPFVPNFPEPPDADTIFNKHDFSELSKDYQSALSYHQEAGDLNGVAQSYINLGRLNFKFNNKPQAKYFIQKGLQTAANTNANKKDMQAAYKVLSEIDKADGNYKDAYAYYNLYVLYRDSINNEENARKLLQSKMQYEFDKKQAVAKAEQDKQNAIAQKTKNRQYFIIAMLAIVVLAVTIIALNQFRNNKQKQQANLLLTEEKEKVESTLSELKSTQVQLIQSEKMASLGELTAGIAHEIQNPLNFVNNFSEVNRELVDELKEELKTGNTDEAISIANDIKENEIKINHHGKRADAIVKGMLQHSRQTSGIKEPTDINALADEYLRLSYHGLRAKDKEFNADIKTDFDESLSADKAGIGKINIVPQDIGRVLLNLYNNAFYAVNEKQKLMANGYQPIAKVSTRRLDNIIEIKVEDNGNGIPQNIVDKIFQPFFTTKPTGDGTGLGLSLSYDIVKAHGGEIKVETKEGEGTAFIIHLPIT